MALPAQTDDSLGASSIILWGHRYPVESVAFSPSDQLLASGSRDGKVQLWNAKSGTGVSTLRDGSDKWGRIGFILFSPDGTMLASGSAFEPYAIEVWDVKTGVQIASLQGHTNSVQSAAFSPDGEHLVSGSDDKTIRYWHLKTRTHINTIEGHSDRVTSVAFSPDYKSIASGSADSTIRLWSVGLRTHVATLVGHKYGVNSVAFSPSGEYLATGSEDTTVRLWDVGTEALIATLEPRAYGVNSVAFSPGGKYLAIGSTGETIQLWDVESRACISTLNGHFGAVWCVTFSHDGIHLASGSQDHSSRIWDVTPLRAREQKSEVYASQLSTMMSQQDDTATASALITLNNDITGSVTLENSTPIGYGGFGDLFLGVHKSQGKVALKKPRRVLDEALIRRFLREVDLWASVSHRYVLPCLGMCRIENEVYVVSPFIENGDLLSCMNKGMTLDSVKLLYEVAEALAHLHHRGIIHGDVKAQNILLSNDGSALLCDFGLAKAFDTMVTSTDYKGAGSARWMAPELCSGESRSMASDVYSLGITISEVLSGLTPFHDISDNLVVMFQVLFHDARPPKEPLNSPDRKSYATLWETAEKCWAKDPKARPYMAQVLAMLFPLTRGTV